MFAPRVVRERMLQCGKNTWAADVAVLAKNLPRGAELVRGNRALDGFYDIASTRVGDELIRRTRPHFEKLGDRFSRECGHSTMELVFEATTGIDEADFLPVLGFVDGAEILETQLPAFVFAPPDCSGGSIAKEAQTDEHAGFVVQVKSGGGNFHGYCSYDGLGIRGEETARGFEKRQGGTAAEAKQVLQEGIRAESEDF